MSSINFEVKKVKSITKNNEKQLDLFKPKEERSDEKNRKSKKKLVIPLLNKRITIGHRPEDKNDDGRRGTPNDDSRKRHDSRKGSYNLKKLKDDVQIGDNVETEDYEDVPVEEFGAAIFRGMGWHEGTEEASVPVVVPRSKGLGLGADKMVVGRGDGELKRGDCCEVIAGKLKGRVGVVEGWDEVRVLVKVHGEVEALNPNFVVDISAHEFEAKQKMQQAKEVGVRSAERKREEVIDVGKGSSEEDEAWLHEGLVVRVVSRSYRQGTFYRQKVRIVDVTSPRTCMCRGAKQQLLEDMKQSMLETVIPKENDCSVLILTAPHKFKKARLFERRKDTQTAVVRLDDDDDQILRVHYDDICLYDGHHL